MFKVIVLAYFAFGILVGILLEIPSIKKWRINNCREKLKKTTPESIYKEEVRRLSIGAPIAFILFYLFM